MFKLLIIQGHGKNVDGSYDPGAIGVYNGKQIFEADLIRDFAPRLAAYADSIGLKTDIAPDRNHFSFFKHGGIYDVSDYDYVIEVHFNASVKTDGADDGLVKGTMFYISNDETGHSVEDRMLHNIITRCGGVQAWDGVVITQRQYTKGLMVQNAIRKQGVLHAVLETCFVTDPDDISWYYKNREGLARAVIDGVIDGFKLEKRYGIYYSKNETWPNYNYCGQGIKTAEALDTMNVRVKSGIENDIVGVVYPGQRVEVLQILDNGWLVIVWPGSEKGFGYTSNVGGMYYKYV